MLSAENKLNHRPSLESRFRRLSWQLLVVGLMGLLSIAGCTGAKSSTQPNYDNESGPIYKKFSEAVATLSMLGSGCTTLFVDKDVIDEKVQARFLLAAHCMLSYDEDNIGTPDGIAEITPVDGPEAGKVQRGHVANFTIIKTPIGTNSDVALVTIVGSPDFLQNTTPYPLELVGGECNISTNSFAIVTGPNTSPDGIVQISERQVIVIDENAPFIIQTHPMDYLAVSGDSGSPLVSVAGTEEGIICFITSAGGISGGYVVRVGPNSVIVQAVDSLTIPSILDATP